MTSIIRAGHGARRRRQPVDKYRRVASVAVGDGFVEQFEPNSADPVVQPIFYFSGPLSYLIGEERISARSIDEAVEVVRQRFGSQPLQLQSFVPQWDDNRGGVRGSVTQIRTRKSGRQYFQAEFAVSTSDLKGMQAEVFRPSTDANAHPQFLGRTTVMRVRGNALVCASERFCARLGDLVLLPSEYCPLPPEIAD
jgi:hypothetical protein